MDFISTRHGVSRYYIRRITKAKPSLWDEKSDFFQKNGFPLSLSVGNRSVFAWVFPPPTEEEVGNRSSLLRVPKKCLICGNRGYVPSCSGGGASISRYSRINCRNVRSRDVTVPSGIPNNSEISGVLYPWICNFPTFL